MSTHNIGFHGIKNVHTFGDLLLMSIPNIGFHGIIKTYILFGLKKKPSLAQWDIHLICHA